MPTLLAADLADSPATILAGISGNEIDFLTLVSIDPEAAICDIDVNFCNNISMPELPMELALF